MALPDIKGAGILAGFERWGWPWHGSIQSGTIGTTGIAHAQPLTGETWLIDTGRAPPDMTPQEILDEAAAGRTWLNYAHAPVTLGGSTNARTCMVYGHTLPNNSYLHIDEAGACWQITLSFSITTAGVASVTANIHRFGLLVTDGTVNPADIVLTDSITAYTGPAMTSPAGWLNDVYTNGSKALIAFHEFAFSIRRPVVACVEVAFTGVGGSTGAGLSMALSVPIPTSQLYLDQNTTTQAPPYATGVHGYQPHEQVVCDNCYDCDGETPPRHSAFTFTFDGEIMLNDSGAAYDRASYVLLNTRRVYYDQAGSAKAVSLRVAAETDVIFQSVVPASVTGQAYGYNSGGSAIFVCFGTVFTPARIDFYNEKRTSIELIVGGSVLDSASFTARQYWEQVEALNPNGIPQPTTWYTNLISDTAVTSSAGDFVAKLLATGLPAEEFIDIFAPYSFLAEDWNGYTEKAAISRDLSASQTTQVGISWDGLAAAFFVAPPSGTPRTYGNAATPGGALPIVTTGEWFYSRDRKNGTHSISTVRNCWV